MRFDALLKMAIEFERQGVCCLRLFFGCDWDPSANGWWAQAEGAQTGPGDVQPRPILNIRRGLETGARGALREELFKTLVRG